VIGALLTGVNPCDAGPCGSQTRTVVGYGVYVPGYYDVRCVACGAVSSMRPTVAAACKVSK
jgi:hypothetical protein